MKLRAWINVITLVALVVVVILTRHQFTQVFANLHQLSLIAVVALVCIEFYNFYTNAKMYQEYLKALGEKVGTLDLFTISLELNFVNLVFPSGGFSGFSYFSMRLKPQGVSTAKSTMVQAARFGLLFTTFLPLLLLGMFVLAVAGRASHLTILIGSSITTLTVVGSLLALYIVSSETRIRSFTLFLPKMINYVTRALHRRNRELIDIAKVEKVLKELHEDYLLIAKDAGKLKKAFFWAFMGNFTELAVIYLAFVAYGHWINPGALVIGYAIANFAGVMSLFGGVGVYEFLMTSVMASAGVPAALALSATILYRVLNMVIFVPIGYALYRRNFLKAK
ncbi:MAG TPA: lysylphosphatidylglycerol synthase transmembrane domain-containing protein [Candidatus Saccharimonadales bacterium]|nr:lysylphosphatidylglycerol synthase transmembrane domain-containing protein [Candidatus Saccharimonadales bacterium]